jgi:hypothetical protein
VTAVRRRRPDEDCGASLILAIAFVLMVGVISAGLLALATTGLSNRNTLQTVRNRQYAADGAIEQAISQTRTGTCSSPPGSLTDSYVGTYNAATVTVVIRVDWSTACGAVQGAEGTVVAQRNVIFAACENTGAACDPAKVIVRAAVNFQQALGGSVAITSVQSWSVNQ